MDLDILKHVLLCFTAYKTIISFWKSFFNQVLRKVSSGCILFIPSNEQSKL